MSGTLPETKVTCLLTLDHAVGEWVAHCLEFDIIAQGTSQDDAIDALNEALDICLNDDLSADLNPLDRPRAPQEYWAQAEQVERGADVEVLTGRVLFSRPGGSRMPIVAALEGLRSNA